MFAESLDTAPQRSKTPGSRIAAFLSRICSLASVHRNNRRLRLCETLSLGEKRFIAVVEYGGNKFLLAGTPVNISLLQRLDASPESADPVAVAVTESGTDKFSKT